MSVLAKKKGLIVIANLQSNGGKYATSSSESDFAYERSKERSLTLSS